MGCLRILQIRGVEVNENDGKFEPDIDPMTDPEFEDADLDLLDEYFGEDIRSEDEGKDLGEIAPSDRLRLYRKEMARFPILTNEEEVLLAVRKKAGELATAQLAEAPEHESRDEWQVLIQDGLNARDHLAKANKPLVVNVAKRYMSRGVPFKDLIQEGHLGLMKAVEKFDYHRGFLFSTYATWWVRKMITDVIADQGDPMRVPMHMIDRIRQLHRVARELEQEKEEKPTIEEIAEEMKCEPREAQWIMRVGKLGYTGE